MQEKLISLETAKLAKEKGFKPEREWNPKYVSGYIDYSTVTDEPERGIPLTEFKEEDYVCEGYYLAPTQALLQAWLRTKDIHVTPEYLDKDEYRVKIFNRRGYELASLDLYDSYEEVLEAGLREGLKLIS